METAGNANVGKAHCMFIAGAAGTGCLNFSQWILELPILLMEK